MNIKIFVLIASILVVLSCKADVTFQFAANTMEEVTIKTRMESSISSLLTEINRAGTDGDSLNLSGINMNPVAKERLIALWQDSPFVCDKSSNISECLQDFQGYQVRAIPVTMKSQNSSYNQLFSRELTVSLNKSGVITGVRPAWELHEDVEKILTPTGKGGIIETRIRREILKWIEDYRTLYTIKDLDGIANVINDFSPTEKNNEQLLSGLKRMFASEDFSTEIDHISIMKSGLKANIYGLTFHQKFNTNNYSDSGWFFFLWDLNDPEKPQIHVRTWQSDEEASKDGVFTLGDFFIP